MSALAERSVVTFANDTPPPSGSSEQGSSPIKAHGRSTGLVQVAVEKGFLVPLAPAKLLPIPRARVVFSPRNDTKLFRSTDTILPSPSSSSLPPPASIRSYRDENGYLTPPPSSCASSSSPAGPSRSPSSTPRLARSILKQRAIAAIRIASTVEEGTLNNKEPARLIVTGNRPKPKLMARDSFQLAMMRTAAAAEGSKSTAAGGAGLIGGNGKGKEKGLEEMPASDDSAASDDIPEVDDALDADENGDESEEEEETIEAQGALSTASLVRILLDGAEDLLTLEEAYNELLIRLRANLASTIELSDSVTDEDDHVRIATRPIRDDAPAVVRALVRDLNRLLGKMPSDESRHTGDASPFRGLQPLRDDPHTEAHISSSPTEINKRAVKRQGYTEAEVRYRREAAGVGQAALKLLAYILHEEALFYCFSTADLRSLVDLATTILRTPKLPTPNPKRTYYASICIIAQIRVPAEAVAPIREKLARAVESGLNETLGTMGTANESAQQGGATAAMSVIKKEAYHAAVNLLSTYPELFVHHYAELLPVPLKAMAVLHAVHRNKASAVCAAYAAAKISAFSMFTSIAHGGKVEVDYRKEALDKLKSSIAKSEALVIAQLKGTLKSANGQVMMTSTGEKKIEANALEQRFKDTIGTTEGVQWACAAWSVIVCLLGSGYASSGLAAMFDHIMNRSMQASNNTTRPLLARTAWSHAIRAYLVSSPAYSICPSSGTLQTSYKAFNAEAELADRLATIRLPVDLALDKANSAGSVIKALETLTDGSKGWFWQRKEKSKKVMWMTTCGMAAAGLVYAYTGMAIHHHDADVPNLGTSEEGEDAAVLVTRTMEEGSMARLDKVWSGVTRPILSGLFAVKGADKLLLHGWSILLALTAPIPSAPTPSTWTLHRLVSRQYLEGRTFGIEAEPAVAELLVELESASIAPADVPACGASWILRNLSSVLDTFTEMLDSVHGLNEVDDIKWVRMGKSGVVIPAIVAQVWTNITTAIASVIDKPDELSAATHKAVRAMMHAFSLNPAVWLPLTLLNPDETLSQDADTTRLALLSQLLTTLIKSVGQDVFVATRIPTTAAVSGSAALSYAVQSSTDAARPIGVADEEGGGDSGSISVSPISIILHGLLCDSQLALPPTQRAQLAYQTMLTRVFSLCIADDAQSTSNIAKGWCIMRDVLARLSGLFGSALEDGIGEAARMDVWKAAAWAVVQYEYDPAVPAAAAAEDDLAQNTDEGEAVQLDSTVRVVIRPDRQVLLGLLAFPFKGDVQSFWHIHATQGDLAAWVELLGVAPMCCLAPEGEVEGEAAKTKGLLDAWAEEVGEHMERDARTSTMSLACLSAALRSTSSSNDQPPPLAFLAIVSTALLESYPSPESLSLAGAATGTDYDLSPSLMDLVESITPFIQQTTSDHVEKVIAELHSALSIWMADELRVADADLAGRLDELYVATLEAVSRAHPRPRPLSPMDFDAEPNAEHTDEQQAQRLHTHIDLFAPRLSRAISSAVPTAFAAFWAAGGYEDIQLQGEESVWEFVRDVVDAVPDLIIVKGINDAVTSATGALRDQKRLGQAEAGEREERYPHSLESARAIRAERERVESQRVAVEPSVQVEAEVEAEPDMQEEELVPSTALPADIGEERADDGEDITVEVDEETPQGAALTHLPPVQDVLDDTGAPLTDLDDADDASHPLGVSDSYDADISHLPIAPSRVTIIRETFDNAAAHSPGPHMPEDVSDGRFAEIEPQTEDQNLQLVAGSVNEGGSGNGDVFGPAVAVRRKRKNGKRTASGSGQSLSQSQSQSQSLPEAAPKRQRIEARPAVHEEEQDAEALVPPTPSGQAVIEQQEVDTRTSPLSSASKWLAKAGSFAFGSPVKPDAALPAVDEAAIEEGEDHEARGVAADQGESTIDIPSRPSSRASNLSSGRRSSRRTHPSRRLRDAGEVASAERARPLKRKSSAEDSHYMTSTPGSDDAKSERALTRSALLRSASDGNITGDTRVSKRVRRRLKGEARAASMAEIASASTPTKSAQQAQWDGEDELLLSPESARAHQEEEERERAARAAAREAKAAPAQRQDRTQSQRTQPTQGRYDDAPDDQTPISNTQLRRRSSRHSVPTEKAAALVPASRSSGSGTGGKSAKTPPAGQAVAVESTRRSTAFANTSAPAPAPPSASARPISHPLSLSQGPSSSPQRSDEQRRVLQMIEQAASNSAAVQDMDFDGLMLLMGHINRLRDAATLNLRGRVEKSRQGKK